MRRSSLGISGLGLAGLLALPTWASAQDSDGDGVADAADAFPCDASRASVSFFPGSTSSALLAFEDQWPGSTDLDFNDVVVRVHYRMERNAAGNVVQLHAVFDPVAVGGALSNGLGLQLPTGRSGVSARRRIAGGAWQALTLEVDASATLVVSPNLRELYANTTGRINSEAGVAHVPGQRLELELTFAPAAALSVAAAPFDVFIFRAGDLGHQIHFPPYAGTAAMNGGLFGTGEDGSTPSRRFVHVSGVPAALNLMTTTRYPLEGVQISALFPDILGFASSGGAQNQSFFASNIVAAQGHAVAAPALPAVPEADRACLGGVIALGQQSYGHTVTANGAYGIQALRYWSVALSGNLYTIHWPVAFVDNASWTGTGTPTNGRWHGLHSGCGNVNGQATCRAVCAALGLGYSAVNTNCSTNYPTTNMNADGRNIYMMNSSGIPSGVWNTYQPNPALGNGNNMEWCRCSL